MEVDERLRWFETKVTSSLKPKAEELKQLLTNEDSRNCLLAFCNNEEIRHTFVYSSEVPGRSLTANSNAPGKLRSKAIFFIKTPSASKITAANIQSDVSYCDCSSQPLEHFEVLAKEIYLPLLSMDQSMGISSDKLLDIMHRLVSSVQLINGSVKGNIILPLPSIDVLSEAAAHGHRRLAVIHVLETTLLAWIKQIKNTLRIDLERDIAKVHGKSPCPSAEVDFWTERLEIIESVNEQLRSPVAVNILLNLEDAQSTYSSSFQNVQKEIARAANETEEQLKYLNTAVSWFLLFENAKNPRDLIKSFGPLMRMIFLLWEHSGFYHQKENITRLLKMAANGVVKKARELVGPSVLRDLLRSHACLREALHICASFRGCYLDTKDKADSLNKMKLKQMAEFRTENVGIVWHSKMYKESRTPKGGTLFTVSKDAADDIEGPNWTDSPWPARNSHVFHGLNSFMERCNDVLELVETTRHFTMLSYTAEVGGAGSTSLDAIVRDIHSTFLAATKTFQESVKEVLDISENQNFEKSFFVFRSVIRDLESRLGEVLHRGFQQCWDTTSRLRLLEVFEGTSSRQLVQDGIKNTVNRFIFELTEEVQKTTMLFKQGFQGAPSHSHLPPVVNQLLWLTSLKTRLHEPLMKLHLVSPMSLKGDDGWKLRDSYADLLKEIERTEHSVFQAWIRDVEPELHLKLQQPLLIRTFAEDGHSLLKVNLDRALQQIIRESFYLKRMYSSLQWTEDLAKLITTADPSTLQLMAARLEVVTSRYNELIRSMKEIERPLFHRKLLEIELVIEEGTNDRCWKDADSTDFVERAVHMVCDDVYHNLGIVQKNFISITELVNDWAMKGSDTFSDGDLRTSISMTDLNEKQRKYKEELASKFHLCGIKIVDLVNASFEAVNIGQASPAWMQYLDFVNNTILEGLKQSVISSLSLLLNRMVASKNHLDPSIAPVLFIRMELIGSEVTFTPPLDTSSSSTCLSEYLDRWLTDILDRPSYLAPFNSGYREAIETDPEIQNLIERIKTFNQETVNQCQGYVETYKQFAFLWLQDVKMTFDEFLKGNISSKPRDMSRQEMIRSRASITSGKSRKEPRESSSRTSSVVTSIMSGVMGLSERAFLVSKKQSGSDEDNLPTLDDFDNEIEIYRKAKEDISAIEEVVNVGWICLNMQPIKKTLETYSSKWMFTYTKYLSDQITSTLTDFDAFLKRIEPGIEAITGQERDIMSFMKLMRIFNEVSAQQSALDSKFIGMKRSITILEKYKQKLPESTEKFYKAAPVRWNNLKMKVNQAKQRLGPRIQSEAEEVSKTLQEFGGRCRSLISSFEESEALDRRCHVYTAFTIMESFQKKFDDIKAEAQDLVELQELLEDNVTDFSLLQSLFDDLQCLRQTWDVVKSIQEHHTDWKRHRWQKIRSRTLKRLLDGELEQMNNLPPRAHTWDVVVGLQETVHSMLACVPFMEDLGKAAMRTRHWKQLVRVTGGAVNITNQGLVNMTLGQFLDLGLQSHADEVMAVVQRATKDLVIENTLKTYEEVWLSKVFELKKHTRIATASGAAGNNESPASEYGVDSDADAAVSKASRSRVSVGSIAVKTESRFRRISYSGSSLTPSALASLSQEYSDVCLLKNTKPILEELESHQLSLQLMLDGGAASSFTDDILKWQKTLQNIESVLTVWIQVQNYWIQMNDVFISVESRVALPNEATSFAAASRDFVSIMKVIERNSNVLQACSISNIQMKLEKIQLTFAQCYEALLGHVDRKRQKCARLYFLPDRDVLKISCLAYDPRLLNPEIHKLYQGVAELDVTETTTEEQKCYQIVAVKSATKERLLFSKPLLCDVSVEHWLNTLQSSIKSNLQHILGCMLNDDSGSGNDQQDDVVTQQTVGTTKLWKDLVNDLQRALDLPFTVKAEHPIQCIILALKVFFSNQAKDFFTNAAPLTYMNQIRSRIEEAITLISSAIQNVITHPVDEAMPEGGTTAEFTDDAPAVTKVKQVTIDVRGTEQSQTFTHLMNQRLTSPRDLQCIQSVLALLVYQNEIASYWIEHAKSGVTEKMEKFSQSFDWESVLKYEWIKEGMHCQVRSHQVCLEYGFEYQGADMVEEWFPTLDRSLYYAMKAIYDCRSVLEQLIQAPGYENLVHDLAGKIARPLFTYKCLEGTDGPSIVNIFKGIAASGCWVYLQNIEHLPRSALSLLSQLSSAVLDGISAKKSLIVLCDEEVNLDANGRLFLSLASCDIDNKSAKSSSTILNQSILPHGISNLYNVPSDLLERQRVVQYPMPDRMIILKSELILNGFEDYQKLSFLLLQLSEALGKVILQQNHLLWRVAFDSSYVCGLICRAIRIGRSMMKEVLDSEKGKLLRKQRDFDPVLLAVDSNDEDQEVGHIIHSLDEQEGTTAIDMFIVEQQVLVLAIKRIMTAFCTAAEEQLISKSLKECFPDATYNYSFEVEDSIMDGAESFSTDFASHEENEEQNIEDIKESDDENSECNEGKTTIEEIVNVAITEDNLSPNDKFVSKVIQLRDLADCNNVILVTGQPATGKTSCIKAFLNTQKKIGYRIKKESLWPGTALPHELFGYYNKKTSRWEPGVYPTILNRICAEGKRLEESNPSEPQILCIHIDGQVPKCLLDTFCECLQTKGIVKMPDGETIKVPQHLLYIWEIPSVEDLPPSFIFESGLLHIDNDVVPWQLLIQKWLLVQPESKRDYLESLCDRYLPATVDFLLENDEMTSSSQEENLKKKFVIPMSISTLVQTSFTLFEASVAHAEDIANGDLENYFNYSVLWGFGSCLSGEEAEVFGLWWRDTWNDFVRFPKDAQVWENLVHPESHEFVPWSSVLPAYSGGKGMGISQDAFVPTAQNMAILHWMIVLSDSGKPVLLVGPSECGKTEIVQERLRGVSSDVAEVLTLEIKSNALLDAKDLFQRINRTLEWKHSNVYVPKGNKKLMCLIDDISLIGERQNNYSTGCEMLRQLLSENGTACNEDWELAMVKGVSYFATYNNISLAHAPVLSERLTRQWNTFYFPYPSVQEQKTILGTLVKTHFQGTQTSPASSDSKSINTYSALTLQTKQMTSFLDGLINVTVEMQETMRKMYLPTAERCYYIFTMETLIKLCRNLCHALVPSSPREQIMSVWISECHWIYGKLLRDQIDYERWRQSFLTISKKSFGSQEMEVISAHCPFVTSVLNMNSVATNAMPTSTGNDAASPYSVLSTDEMGKVEETFAQFISENNKDNTRIKLVLFPDTINLLNRLIHIIQSPYKCGHALLLAKGSPSLPNALLKAAGYICGSTVHEIQVSSLLYSTEYRRDNFKMDLKALYILAGTKGEKILLTVQDRDLKEEYLADLSDLILADSISHFFNSEEETSIVNAIRTDVIQAGLTYSKDVAWKFFLDYFVLNSKWMAVCLPRIMPALYRVTVKSNLRVVFVVTETDNHFQRICRENSSFVSSLQVLTLHNWSADELVINGKYFLKELTFLNAKEKENIAHTLASMHLKAANIIDSEEGSQYSYLANNDVFQNFLERFVYLLTEKYTEIKSDHQVTTTTLGIMDRANDLSNQLSEKLDHEKMVLEQKKMGNCSLLNQIGQDKAISEEQIRLVERQQKRIEKLKKLLPKYEEAHERAVFKAAAMVKETKHVLKELDSQGLTNLRSLQKADSEIEDLLAAVIVIVKSPSSDLTWNKGAKRIMANLERFQEDLSLFDEIDVPESTLNIAETYIAKPHFTPGYLENRTNNPAIGSLVLWVRGVARYHRMMLSRVSPLHSKVEQTIQAIDDAVQKMSRMQDKLKDLSNRLHSLSGKFEEASVDKSKQHLLTVRQGEQLQRAGEFEMTLSGAQERWKNALKSISHRFTSVIGNVAIAAGLSAYLGPFTSKLRSRLLFDEWPKCLTERGLGLDLYTLTNYDELSGVAGGDRDTLEVAASELLPDALEETSDTSERKLHSGSEVDDGDSSVSTSNERDDYCIAVVSLSVGSDLVRSWLTKDLPTRQIENLAILYLTQFHVIYVIDPYDQAHKYLALLYSTDKNIVEVDMMERDLNRASQIEQAVAGGSTLLVYLYEDSIDQYFLPLIEALHTRKIGHDDTNPILVKMNGRRIYMPASFQLIFILRHDASLESLSSLVSFGTLIDIRPDTDELEGILRSLLLAKQDEKSALCIRKCRFFHFRLLQLLELLDKKIMKGLEIEKESSLWDEAGPLTKLVQQREKYQDLLNEVKKKGSQWQKNRGQFDGLVQCALSLFQMIRSFAIVDRGYRFSFEHFIGVLTDSIGGPTELDEKFVYQPLLKDRNSREYQNYRRHDSSIPSQAPFGNSLVGISKVMDSTNSQLIEEEVYKDSQEDTDALLESIIQDLNGMDLASLDYQPTSTFGRIPVIPRDLIKMVFNGIHRALQKKDQELLTCLIWLCVHHHRSEMARELINLLFDQDESSSSTETSNQEEPDWLPPERWNILCKVAQSCYSLKSIPHLILSSPTSWRNWFASTSPWYLPPGATTEMNGLDGTAEDEEDAVNFLIDASSLLIVKILRFDAFKPALMYFAKRALERILSPPKMELETQTTNIRFDSNCLTIILKPSFGFTGSIRLSELDPADKVKSAAKLQGFNCFHVKVLENNGKTVDVTLNSAIQTESWILIEDVENGDDDWLTQFTGRILRLRKQQDSKYRIFMTYQSQSNKLPAYLLRDALKVSMEDFFVEKNTLASSCDLFAVDNVVQCLKMTFEIVSPSTFESLKVENLSHRSLAFGLCVYHGILLAVQKFSSRTLTEMLPLTAADLNDSLSILLASFEQEDTLKEVLKSLPETIYEPKCRTSTDKTFLRSCFKAIFDSLSSDTISFIKLGGWSIPVPPVNVDPLEYKVWLLEKLQEESNHVSWPSFGVSDDLVQLMDEAISNQFFVHLQHQFSLSTCLFQHPARQLHGGFREVQQTVDNCLHYLPLLLNTSVEPMMEVSRVGYYLIQECVNYDKVISLARTNLKEVQSYMLRGLEAIPPHLKPIMGSLLRHVVPSSWLPTMHSSEVIKIQEWLPVINAKRDFLRKWITEQVLEIPVNLALLAKPSSFFAALHMDAAMTLNAPPNEVTWHCQPIKAPVLKSGIRNDQGLPITITLQGMSVLGASFNLENGHLVPLSSSTTKLTKVTTEVSFRVSEPGDDEQAQYHCPVYQDPGRLQKLFSLPFSIDGKHSDFELANASLVLMESNQPCFQ